ncbi:MAG: hypothetical protein ACE144_02935 [Thermodesulfobacteriota bacterium]
MRMKKVSILFLSLMLLCFGPQCGKNKNVPDHLLGEWTTSDPKYEDRFFEIDRATITFGVGEGQSDTHSITSIEIEKESLYTIYYKNGEGLESKFSFTYQPTGQGEIKLKNQDQFVWTKTKK